MNLDELTAQIVDFSSWSHADRIRLFGWYLHTGEGIESFREAQVRKCYEGMHLEQPSAIGPFLHAMANGKTKSLLYSKDGYRLEKKTRDDLTKKYGRRAGTVQVTQLLRELPDKVPALVGREYLDEALRCFGAEAYRASIIMTWNLTFDFLCDFVVKKKLAEFNQQLPKSFPKAEIQSVQSKADFGELRESQVLQVCRSANITSSDIHRILKEKLDRRNSAAHPSGIAVPAPIAETYIVDLVTNVILNATLS